MVAEIIGAVGSNEKPAYFVSPAISVVGNRTCLRNRSASRAGVHTKLDDNRHAGTWTISTTFTRPKQLRSHRNRVSPCRCAPARHMCKLPYGRGVSWHTAPVWSVPQQCESGGQAGQSCSFERDVLGLSQLIDLEGCPLRPRQRDGHLRQLP